MSNLGQKISALLLLACIAFFSGPQIGASSHDPLMPCHRHSRPFRAPGDHRCCFMADRHALPAHVDATPAPAEIRFAHIIYQPASRPVSSVVSDGRSRPERAFPIVPLRI